MNNLTRRDFSAIAAGLGLSFLLPGMSPRAADKRGKERMKSLITVWLAGGPSQFETWDPHPGTKNGGDVSAIKTTIPGVKIADMYPRVAEQIHHLSVIRSLTSKEGDHERGTYYTKTGYRPDVTLKHPSLGAIAARELPDDSIKIPIHVSLLNSQWPSRGGHLGAEYDAFKVFNPGKDVQNMQACVPDERQKRRLQDQLLLASSFAKGRFSRLKRTKHQDMIDRSLTMMNSDQLKAFLIESEPDATKTAYGNTNFGRGCLVARRLVETGVRSIEVTLNGFDTHANNHEGHKTQAAILDPALAALIHDLKQRDLFESTVLFVIGEFGRTPRINPLGGRDHWPHGFSCLVGGGGIKSGVLIGETDPDNDDQKKPKPPKDPIVLPDLFATILQTLGLSKERLKHEYQTPIGRPMAMIDGGKPIKKLLG